MTAQTTAPPPRRRLQQKGAAAALAATLIAIPAVPSVLDAVLPERVWDDTAATGPVVDITSVDGNVVDVAVPDGWESQDSGNRVFLRTDGATVIVSVFDREGRDPRSVAERVMRKQTIQGWASAWDGGQISSTDGALRGDTCVAIVGDATGSCAFLADDDVVVAVTSLAKPGAAARPMPEIIDTITRSGS